MRKEKIRLGAFLLPAGHHIAGWRHPSCDELGVHDFSVTVQCARALEQAKFDLIFFSDVTGIRFPDFRMVSHTARGTALEAITHAAALAVVTSHIGIVATASTSFYEPYNIARQFASIDHLSRGRAAWNLVTSPADLEAENYGMDRIALHADRYDRAEEYIDVVMGLWNTWEDGAFLADKKAGVFFDENRVHALNHKGKHFSVRGPLNVARSPQGHPVVVQAGGSDIGRSLGARTAEIIFCASQTLQEAQEFYSDLKERMKSFGRAPDDMKIMPGFCPIVGRDEGEARAKFEQLQQLIDPVVGVGLVSQMLGYVDLSKCDVDGPIPELPETNAIKSRQQLIVDLARREGLTIRQLYLRTAGARGHYQIVGTPAQIVDEMEERFMKYGADGFNIMPATTPGGVHDFVELVIPELRRRGLVQTEYSGSTLRGNIGTKPGPVTGVARHKEARAV
jgi:FMN-dependent oxidoreductase (nitrilotriacetate monooxygenase family)